MMVYWLALSGPLTTRGRCEAVGNVPNLDYLD
jgi:hypothetical protein